MRKPNNPPLVPWAIQSAQFKREIAEAKALAVRLEHAADPLELSPHDRVFLAAALRAYVRVAMPPARPRGRPAMVDPLEVEQAYLALTREPRRFADGSKVMPNVPWESAPRTKPVKHAEAIGLLADHFHCSEAAIRAALQQMGVRT